MSSLVNGKKNLQKVLKMDHSHRVVFTALDLELNQASTGAKIIQIGAVVGNLETGQVLDKLSLFIDPKETLEPYIIQLTKIKQSDVDGAHTLIEAYNKLCVFHAKHGSFVNLVQWGQGDALALKEQLTLENPNIDIKWPFGRRDIDVKTIYSGWRLANSLPPTGGLSRAAAQLNIKFKGQAHNALSDAENTWYVFCEILKKFKNE